MKVTSEGLVLEEIAEGVEVDEIRARTGTDFLISHGLRQMLV